MSQNTPKAPITAQQTALAANAADQYNNYMGTYRPFEQKYTADVMGDTSARVARVTGRSNADVAQSAGSAIKPGVDPTSGAAYGAVASNKIAAVKSQATVKGTQAVQSQQLNAEQGIVNMGQGKAATTQAGMSDMAGTAATSAIADARMGVEHQAFVSNSVGSAIGAGAFAAKKMTAKDPADGATYNDANGDINNVDFGTFGDTSSMGW